MPFLPFATKTENHFNKRKMIGVYIEKEHASYLSLYALYRNTTISDILRELVFEYIQGKEKEEKLLQHIAKEAVTEWRRWILKNNGLPGWRNSEQLSNRWDDFKKEAVKNLKKRKIYPDIITKILDLMENIEIDSMKDTENEN